QRDQLARRASGVVDIHAARFRDEAFQASSSLARRHWRSLSARAAGGQYQLPHLFHCGLAFQANRSYSVPAPMAEITLEHLTKTYPGGITAVDDVSLEVEDGEFLVLVGPSGCGKSTLLRMIAGLEEVTQGTISIGGKDVTALPPRS